MGIWFYHHPDPGKLVERSCAYFAELGFDITGSPWYNKGCAQHWARALAGQSAQTGHVLGEIYTSWDNRWEALVTAAEYAWTVEKPAFEGELAEGSHAARHTTDRRRGGTQAGSPRLCQE